MRLQAPVSLAGALEEYLKDPNFEQNRIEYRTNKEAAERAERLGISAPPPQAQTVEKGGIHSYLGELGSLCYLRR